ncbi:O-antigen ligase family protein [Bacteroidota bacterium]
MNEIANLKQILRQGKISALFLLIVVFFMPISRELFIIALWPWIFFLLLESLLYGWNRWFSFKEVRYSVYLLPGMFLLMLISLLWTRNQPEGWHQIGRSMLLIIFPLLLGFDKTISANGRRLQNILKTYVFGSILSLLLLVVYALKYSLSFSDGKLLFDPYISSWEHVFFYNHFSVLIHPTYYGMMILMSAAICLSQLKRNSIFSWPHIWTIILAIIFLSSLYLISSRTILIGSVIIIGWFVFINITNKILRFSSVFSILIIIVLVIGLHPRFAVQREIITNQNDSLINQIIEKTDRGKTWYVSAKLIGENPLLGLGIGDVVDDLTRAYHDEGYFEDSSTYFNCHNQFLETWLGLGISGVILLIGMLVYPFLSPNRINWQLYGSFFILVLIGFSSESQLNRIWGVAFFSLFYILLTKDKQAAQET